MCEQAAAAGLRLVSATPFDHVRWKRRGYVSRGHRRRTGGAEVRGAIEHRFMTEKDAALTLGDAEPYIGKRAVW